jgi:hypothetical protein
MLAKPRLHGAAYVAKRRHCFKALLFGRRREACFYGGTWRRPLG